MVIGDYPAISLAQARKARDTAEAQLAKGGDPNDAKREEKRIRTAAKGETFEKLGLAFLEKQRVEGKSKATLDQTGYPLKLVNRDFGRKPITEITAPMIFKTLRKVEAKGNYETANRLRARIGSCSGQRSCCDRSDICAARCVDPPHAGSSRHNHRSCSAWSASQRYRRVQRQATTLTALKQLAMLAKRPVELRHAKREEFDLEERVWAISAGKIKMRRDRNVPLPVPAISLLKELYLLTGESKYLFASLNSLICPMSENTLNAALRRMGYAGGEMTAHGFRSSFSTLANESGLWNPDAFERALAHERLAGNLSKPGHRDAFQSWRTSR